MKEMEGLAVVGNRNTFTIAAGEVGNDSPIVTTHESWYSPDLHMAVSSISDDPRWGHMTTRLTNIQRNKPDPSLFQVPGDYQIKDENHN